MLLLDSTQEGVNGMMSAHIHIYTTQYIQFLAESEKTKLILNLHVNMKVQTGDG